ncbi:MAG: glucosidase [Acidobacteria bacterium]|nr:MAG: glucosidase [Acidobacteriota bacterium]
MNAEHERLAADAKRTANWKRWGPYLSERQWATVREDYSPDGGPWEHFPHDHARSRAYRWGEDGLLGMTDRECRLCFALALWNGKDPILKERLFGLTGPEGNHHGEDVKEQYFYLDSTPTHSYLKALYKYPQTEFPYTGLIEENRRRSKLDPEFELIDTGIFDSNRYFDVLAEYAKNSPDDILIRITMTNRGPETATLHLLPTLWFRNTWAWRSAHEGTVKPQIRQEGGNLLVASHESLGSFRLAIGSDPDGKQPPVLFTENESNARRLWNSGTENSSAKDAFHEFVIHGRLDAVNAQNGGTKSAPHYFLTIPAGGSQTVKLRLFPENAPPEQPFGSTFDEIFSARIREADEFYSSLGCGKLSDDECNVVREAYAGLLWSKQFYHYIVEDWLSGDPGMKPPESRLHGRNKEWQHVYSRDVISMPDKWEYPWFAGWDLAFHMIPFASIDPDFAKSQLILFLREWYMHPNGQLPAYEFAFDDVNPPVHAWAAWRVYKISGARGRRDRDFLESVFQKLLLNFTWWVNRKDVLGKNLFAGGFLGLDNIGVFDRSKPLPTGGILQQADATAWMAFYCATMLSMALELAQLDGRIYPAYEDMASKFLEHFYQIADAINRLGGAGLWYEQDGFYYDQIRLDHSSQPLKIRSLVGLLPLITAEVYDDHHIEQLSGFHKRLVWFRKYRGDLPRQITQCEHIRGRALIALPSRERLQRMLRYLLDENEFLSPYGIRSVSKFHETHPYEFAAGGTTYRVNYEPRESTTGSFGGNSNWRGPIWIPINYLLIEALERYHHFYGHDLKVECPTGSGNFLTLGEVSQELTRRVASIFLANGNAQRPCHGEDVRWSNNPYWRNLLLFYEYFHGETGKGLGASHQTGWTALIIRHIEDIGRRRDDP